MIVDVDVDSIRDFIEQLHRNEDFFKGSGKAYRPKLSYETIDDMSKSLYEVKPVIPTGHQQTKGNIFISYRRDESAGYAGRLADSFQEHFGEDNVFRDIDSLEPGLDFAEAIDRAVDSSEVLIAVIGRNWLAATDAAGHKRLEDADD